MLYLELLIQGVVQGSIYALIALGLTLVYGLLRILHVAHAALFTLGGYVGVLVTNQTGSLVLAMVAAALAAGMIGMAMYRFAYQPILSQPPFIALIASVALFIASEEIFRIVFGPYGLSYAMPPLGGRLELFDGFLLKTFGNPGHRPVGRCSGGLGLVVSQHPHRCRMAGKPLPTRRWPVPSGSTSRTFVISISL